MRSMHPKTSLNGQIRQAGDRDRALARLAEVATLTMSEVLAFYVSRRLGRAAVWRS